MRTTDLPVVAQVVDAGADDRVFDTLLLSGPVVIALVFALGRNALTEVLAVAYLAAFLGYLLYKGARE